MEITPQDEWAIKAILIRYRNAGVADPRLPLNVDVDGDGVADAWALDASDNVILVPDVPLTDTVYVSDGDDVAAGGE